LLEKATDSELDLQEFQDFKVHPYVAQISKPEEFQVLDKSKFIRGFSCALLSKTLT
jgi:hypothetical protein